MTHESYRSAATVDSCSRRVDICGSW